MATKDISDRLVLEAYREFKTVNIGRTSWIADDVEWPYDILMRKTGRSFKECWRACERAVDRDLIEYGVSLRSGWITNKGKDILDSPPHPVSI
jgi:hypothetical protein